MACAADGRQPVLWDGRDYLGNWVQPGRYRFHGIRVPKLSLRYVGSIGNAGQPPYRTADGRGSWGGVWGNVMDVCAVDGSPDSDMLVLWAFEEGEGGLIRMSQDGEVRWKQHIQWWTQGQATAVCSDGKSTYVVSSSAKDAPGTAKSLSGSSRIGRCCGESTCRRARINGMTRASNKTHRCSASTRRATRPATSAVHEGRLYITSPAQGRVFVVDAADGKLLSQWPHERVSGVAWDRQSRLLVGLGAEIAELNPDTGARVRTVCDLGGPVWDVDCAATGTLAVSVRGPRQQVVLLDTSGRELQSLGKRGGRPAHAKFIPTDLYDPAGLCVTANGKLFVAEDSAPRRFSRWRIDPSGSPAAFERDWHGPYYLSGMWGVDEQHPEIFYGDSHGDVVRYVFNYDTGKWSVDAAWRKVYVPDRHGDVTKWMPRILHRDGKTYWASGSAGLFEIRDDAWLPVAAVYGCWVVPDEKEGWTWYHQARDRRERKGTWSDLNGDGRRQADEWFVTDKPAYPLDEAGPQQGWASFWADDFTLVHARLERRRGCRHLAVAAPVASRRPRVPLGGRSSRRPESRHRDRPRLARLPHGVCGQRRRVRLQRRLQRRPPAGRRARRRLAVRADHQVRRSQRAAAVARRRAGGRFRQARRDRLPGRCLGADQRVPVLDRRELAGPDLG